MFFKTFQFKLFTSFILFGLILSSVTFYIFTKVIEDGYLSYKTDLFYEMLVEKDEEITSYQKEVKLKIDVLSSNYHFKEYIVNNNLKDIYRLFFTILKAEDNFISFALIGKGKQDSLKLFKDKTGNIDSSKDQDFIDIKNKTYFKDLQTLQDNELYISDFIYDEAKNKAYYKVFKKIAGKYIVLDVDLQRSIFKSIKSSYKENWYLVDKDGKFILHKNDKFNWSKYKGINIDIKTQFPQDYQQILKNDVYFNDQIMSKRLNLINENELILVLSYTEDFVDDLKNDYYELFRIMLIVSIVISIILAFILSKPFARINNKLNSLNLDLDKQIKKRTKELSDSLSLIDKHIITSRTDVHGKITYVSEAFCKVSGYTKDELLGKNHNIIKNETNPKDIYIDLWSTIVDGKSWSGELINKDKYGKKYYVYINIEPQYDKDKIVGYISVAEDISDKKKVDSLNEHLSLKLKEYNAIINNANSGIGMMDSTGNIIKANNACSRFLGYSKRELYGKNIITLVEPNHKKKLEQAIRDTVFNGSVSHIESVYRHKDGQDVYLDISLDLLPDKKTFAFIINSLEEKIKLETLNKELEQKVKDEVQKNIEQQEKHVEDKIKNARLSSIGSLAAGITHEINTPLTYIKGNMEMMRYDVEDMEESQLKETFLKDFGKVDEGIARIEAIIDTMREVSQSTQESKYAANIYETLIIASTIINNKAKQISRVFINNELFSIGMQKDKYTYTSFIQKQRVEQLWIILLNNALDALDNGLDYEDRRIDIFIENIDAKIKVTIKDNGGGIKEEILEHIFDPFIGTKKHGGLGIGLNVAKKIVDDQDGDINIYNDDNGAVIEVLFNEHR